VNLTNVDLFGVDSDFIPTILFIGPRKSGKSALVANLAGDVWKRGLLWLSGKNVRANGRTIVTFSESFEGASVLISKFRTRGEMFVVVKNRVSLILSKVLINYLSSAPRERERERESEADFLKMALDSVLNTRYDVLNIDSLVCSVKKDEYEQALMHIIKIAILATGNGFIGNWHKLNNKDSDASLHLIDDLVWFILGKSEIDNGSEVYHFLDEIVDLVVFSITFVLEKAGFECEFEDDVVTSALARNVNADGFEECIKVVLMSKSKKGYCTVAGFVRDIFIKVPGSDIFAKSGIGKGSFRIVDFPGARVHLTSDSDRIGEIFNLPIPYDFILYVTDLGVSYEDDKSWIDKFNNIPRRCGLATLLTNLKGSITSEDDDEDVLDIMDARSAELEGLCRELLRREGVCVDVVSRKIKTFCVVSDEKLAGGESYLLDSLRSKFSGLVNVLSKSDRFDVMGSVKVVNFIKFSKEFSDDIKECVISVLSEIRDFDGDFDWYDVKLFLWSLLDGAGYGVGIVDFYRRFVEECLHLLPPSVLGVSFDGDDVGSVMIEFKENLRMILIRRVSDLFMSDSVCKSKVTELAIGDCGNKWGVFYQLIDILNQRLDISGALNSWLNDVVEEVVVITNGRLNRVVR
jgi:hypothetical protein